MERRRLERDAKIGKEYNTNTARGIMDGRKTVPMTSKQ